MNILLLGYGKMGQLIDQLATDQGHHIVARIASQNRNELETLAIENIDVAIEFSQPDAAVDNLKFCLKHGIPVLSGTTGWLNYRSEIEEECRKVNGTFFYASNYSIGVNIFFKLNEHLAAIMNGFDTYDVSIDEIHHTQKKDAPSGTAITLAEDLIKKIQRLSEWKLGGSGKGVIPIAAFREEDVPGTHSIEYKSKTDAIKIEHKAHSREGFAKGALSVAEWLTDKKGVLGMDDFLKL